MTDQRTSDEPMAMTVHDLIMELAALPRDAVVYMTMNGYADLLVYEIGNVSYHEKDHVVIIDTGVLT